MASQGPLYPATVTTEIGPSGDNDWLTPGNVGADDAAEAQITAATYDATDHSWRLLARNLGFTIPAGATINGITVEIERRAFAGAAEDQEVRLSNAAGTLVGDDKQTATAWPTTAGIATYGGAADTWAAGLTVTDINDPDFGVALIVLATAANTDIGVDFIRVTVDYTPAPVTLAGVCAGVSTVAAALTVSGVQALAAQSAGSSTVAGALSVSRPLAGISAGSTAPTGQLAVIRRLAGISAGVGGASGALSLQRALSAASVGSGSVSGALAVTGGSGGTYGPGIMCPLLGVG